MMKTAAHTDQEEIWRRDRRVHGRLRPRRATHRTVEGLHVLPTGALVDGIGAMQLPDVGRETVRAHRVQTRQDDRTVEEVAAEWTAQEVALAEEVTRALLRWWWCVHCGGCSVCLWSDHGQTITYMLQHVTACYSMLQHVTACYSMLQHVTACYSMLQHYNYHFGNL